MYFHYRTWSMALLHAPMDCSSSSYIEKQCCVPWALRATYCLQLELKSQDECLFAIQKKSCINEYNPYSSWLRSRGGRKTVSTSGRGSSVFNKNTRLHLNREKHSQALYCQQQTGSCPYCSWNTVPLTNVATVYYSRQWLHHPLIESLFGSTRP